MTPPDTALDYPRLRGWLASRRDPGADRRTAARHMREIAALPSRAWVGGFRALLDLALPRLYDGIRLHDGGLDLRALVRGANVVFVPNHQSHADYIVLNRLLLGRLGRPVLVAGGINLDVPLVGALFRRSGCFFIRRSLEGNVLYRLVLEAYLHHVLGRGLPLEFFFEGGRSRTGGVLFPKAGLFRMLLDAHRALPAGRRPLLFVPVSIVHEHVPEQRLLARELAEGRRRPGAGERLAEIARLLLVRRLGSVHVSLGDPVEAPPDGGDARALAGRCAEAVMGGIRVTPAAVLACALLEGGDGPWPWDALAGRCRAALRGLADLGAPLAPGPGGGGGGGGGGGDWDGALGAALDVMVANGKVRIVRPRRGAPPAYAVAEGARLMLHHLKSAVLHRLLVPWVLARALGGLADGSLAGRGALEGFVEERRRRLSLETPLPDAGGFLGSLLAALSRCLGAGALDAGEWAGLPEGLLSKARARTAPFSGAGRFIDEATLSAARAARLLGGPGGRASRGDFEEAAREDLARRGAPEESASRPLLRTSLEHLAAEGLAAFEDGALRAADPGGLDRLIGIHEKGLLGEVAVG